MHTPTAPGWRLPAEAAYESPPGTCSLDLQVIRPDPYVEQDGEVVEPIDVEALFASTEERMRQYGCEQEGTKAVRPARRRRGARH
jgi:hypothetical protein